MLAVDSLVTSYDGVVAVNQVTLKVDPGQFVTIVGANGAGKTTLVNTIAGLVATSSGKVSFDGTSITNRPAYEVAKRGIILVPEGRRILGALSVEENLMLGALAARRRGGDELQDLERVYDIFDVLRERRLESAGRLSGGQQQMLAIGRALMGRPRLMLLDEPSLGLSPVLVAQIFEVFRRLHGEGLSILLIEQNARRALDIASYGYVMDRGRLVLEGSAETLRADESIVAHYLGQDPVTSDAQAVH